MVGNPASEMVRNPTTTFPTQVMTWSQAAKFHVSQRGAARRHRRRPRLRGTRPRRRPRQGQSSGRATRCTTSRGNTPPLS